MRRTLCLLIAGLFSQAALPHIVELPLSQHSTLWIIDPVVAVLLLLIGLCFFRGSRIISRRVTSKREQYRRQRVRFWLGWLVLAVALVSPLDVMGEQLFSAHMVQHELLMMVAAPPLIASRPEQAILLGGSKFTASFMHLFTLRSPVILRFYRRMTDPLPAWCIHFAGLWIWHLPPLLNASLSNEWVHSFQHITFLLIAWVFWYSIFRLDRTSSLTAVMSLFLTGIHASLLGALLTFSPVIWYSPYASTTFQWGLTPVQDQQLGGLIMWMPAGIIFIAAALTTMAKLLRDRDHDKMTTHYSSANRKDDGRYASRMSSTNTRQ